MKEVVQLDDADVVDGAGEAVEVLMDHVAADQRALEEEASRVRVPPFG